MMNDGFLLLCTFYKLVRDIRSIKGAEKLQKNNSISLLFRGLGIFTSDMGETLMEK